LAPTQQLLSPSPSATAATPKPTSAKLLITIAALERKLAATGANSKTRPKLLRELAEAQAELSSNAFIRKVNAQIEASEHRRNKHLVRAAAARTRANKADKSMRSARRKAIGHYTHLLRQHPQWCAHPKRPLADRGCADEVLSLLSYEHEQAGDSTTALQLSRELISRFPKSKYVANAHLVVGEDAFAKAAADPSKFKDAQLAYEQVIALGPQGNPVFGYAHYKLAYVHWNLGDFAKALGQMVRVVELGNDKSNSKQARALANSARRDLIALYALSGNPAKAYSFFRRLLPATATRDEQTFQMMRALGQSLSDTGHYDGAVVLYRDLLKRDRGVRSCEHQTDLTYAIRARVSNKPDMLAALKQQLAGYLLFRKAKHPARAKQRCASSTGSQLVDMAMLWHLEAVGSGGVRGTGSKETMELAAQLYRLVIDNFTDEQIASLEPEVSPPAASSIRYAYADLLFFMKEWRRCGPAFDSIAANPASPNAPEAAFAAVVCYSKAHRPPPSGNSELRRLELARKKLEPGQRRMVAAFQRYVCELELPTDAKARKTLIEVKHARARAYFELGRYQHAAAAFKEVAVNHADADSAVEAAQQYVESLQALADKVRPPQPICRDDLKRDLPTLLALHCSSANMSDNEEVCAMLSRVQGELARQ